jgi:hypothetical protein
MSMRASVLVTDIISTSNNAIQQLIWTQRLHGATHSLMSNHEIHVSKFLSLALLCCLVGLAGCGGSAVCATRRILLPGATAFPEGVAASADGRVFAGSAANGQIFAAADCADEARVLATLPESLGAVGMQFDEQRGVLWVCGSSLTTGNAPTVFALDPSSGAVVATHPLETGMGLCNDIAIADDGALYITESFGSIVFRIAAADALSDTPATTWLHDASLAASPRRFGLNGIVVEGRSLYLGHSEMAKIFRVQIGANGSPEGLTELTPSRALVGIDGMRRLSDGRVLVAEGAPAMRVSMLTISGDTVRVDDVAGGLDYPTAVAPTEGDTSAWVTESQFDHFFGVDPSPPGPFHLVRIDVP